MNKRALIFAVTAALLACARESGENSNITIGGKTIRPVGAAFWSGPSSYAPAVTSIYVHDFDGFCERIED